MHRRTLLGGVGCSLWAAAAGCLGVDAESPFELEFEVRTGDSADAVRERVVVVNVSGDAQSVGGYTLAYSSGYEYTFTGGMTLEAGADVAVVSRGAGDGVAESDPPTYYRDADLPELVLEDGTETVRLLDAEEDLVVEATYTEA